ncbi:MAG: NAD(+) synthase [Brevinema sp.]
MKISIAQVNPFLGNFVANKEKIRQIIRRAIADEAHILLLPYGAISGFPQGNLMASEDFRHSIHETLIDLSTETLNTDLAVFIEGQEVLHQGKISKEGVSIEHSGQTHLPLPSIFNQKDFDIFVNVGPKIFEKNKPEAYEMELKILAAEKKAWVFDVNLAGATDEIIFTGLSSITNPEGEIITRLSYAQEDFITIDLEKPYGYPIQEIPAGEEILLQSITIGIQNYMIKNNFSNILVSVSGGIDSALVLALATQAVGAEHISAIYLPSRFSSELSQEEAQKLCSNLSVPLKEISINTLHEQFSQELSFLPKGVWQENIQARIRGSIVMSIANTDKTLVLATSNKTEAAMGYCTLYGDTCGGLAPIADLLKTEVRALCRYINLRANREIIPKQTIDRAPSAELRLNQEDEQSLPNYEFLDQVLFLHCEEGLDYSQICDQLGRHDDVLKIFALLYQSSYKRKQTAPGIKLSKRYFALDWHIPSTVFPWFKNQ